MTLTFRQYGVNGREQYWPVKHGRWKDQPDATQSVKIWTLTIHEPTCRYAKHYQRTDRSVIINDASYGQGHVDSLARQGFQPPTTMYQSVVWQGCKVCGTAGREADFKALALRSIDEQIAIKRAAALHAKAEQAKFEAKRALELAIKDAQEAFYIENFKEQVDRAMAQIETAVRVQWPIDNPEQASLLDTQKEA